jgi:hypothetical protein
MESLGLKEELQTNLMEFLKRPDDPARRESVDEFQQFSRATGISGKIVSSR